MRKSLLFILSVLLVSCGTNPKESGKNEWNQLFNGKDLEGWEIKFKGSPLNVNYKNTFRVEDGIIKVRYDEWDKFNNEFGHLFTKVPYSSYRLRIEYRFVGDQVSDGPSWAFRNSGVMLHSQSGSSMGLDQDFPVSIEAQFLGGNGVDERSTGNLCTPGTHVIMNKELITRHCTNSSSRTYHGDIWVKAEFVVLADSVIHHIIEGDTVITYFKPQIGGDRPADFPLPEGTLLKEGYIALQAESHPVEFRKVELLEMKDKR